MRNRVHSFSQERGPGRLGVDQIALAERCFYILCGQSQQCPLVCPSCAQSGETKLATKLFQSLLDFSSMEIGKKKTSFLLMACYRETIFPITHKEHMINPVILFQ